MPELRQDWLTGRTVIVAENRALRPNEFVSAVAPDENTSTGDEHSAIRKPPQPHCPFCRGNESRTPPAVFESMNDLGQWQVRVVPNRFPALELQDASGSNRPATGAHEVIVEAADHAVQMSALSTHELASVLAAYQQRLNFWRKDGRFRYALLFKNQGGPAGASLAHVHSQFVTMPEVPFVVESEIRRAADQFARDGHCVYCRLCEHELASGERIVLHRDGYLAFCPYASLQPLEVWLFPTFHAGCFEQHLDATQSHTPLADVLRELFTKLETAVPGASYNMLLRNAPWRPELDQACHWRIELLPRFNPLAGLELATSVHINPVPPEKAAARLRAL
jgi:UDPglucose--hexose-1-phosphate uridylyltransferase